MSVILQALRGVSLPIKVFTIAIVTAAVVMFLVNSYQAGTFRQAFKSQLVELLDEKAFQHRVRFSMFVESHYHAARMLASQPVLIDYLQNTNSDAAGPTTAVSKHTPPAWLPDVEFLRASLAPHYVLLLDERLKPIEVYQNWPSPPPRELFALSLPVLLQAVGQTHILIIDGMPYLLAAEAVIDKDGGSAGFLMLSTPLEEAFMIASNGPATDWNLVALIDDQTGLVISSNNQRLIAKGTPFSALIDQYLFTEPEFMALGGMELNFRFASLVRMDSIDSLAGSIMEKERMTQILLACLYMGPFIIATSWLTRRILKLTARIEDFSQGNLGYPPSSVKGDQLDILEQRFHSLIDDIKKRTSQLETANRELEAFAYSVSHDLRAPLRSIDGFSQALDEDYRDRLDADGHDYLHRVRQAAQRMGILIDEMLMLSRVSRGEMKIRRVDLSRIVDSVVEELSISEPERQVEFVIARGVIVQGDEALLRVVMTNLLDNAWKFTAQKSRARIEFGLLQKDNHQNKTNSGSPIYFVADDGAGFEMEHYDKLFGVFQRLHRDSEFPGTGIGLATVQRIIRRHEGKIWAESAPGRGAIFYFSL